MKLKLVCLTCEFTEVGDFVPGSGIIRCKRCGSKGIYLEENNGARWLQDDFWQDEFNAITGENQ